MADHPVRLTIGLDLEAVAASTATTAHIVFRLDAVGGVERERPPLTAILVLDV